jgi:hypothetical protein
MVYEKTADGATIRVSVDGGVSITQNGVTYRGLVSAWHKLALSSSLEDLPGITRDAALDIEHTGMVPEGTFRVPSTVTWDPQE